MFYIKELGDKDTIKTIIIKNEVQNLQNEVMQIIVEMRGMSPLE